MDTWLLSKKDDTNPTLVLTIQKKALIVFYRIGWHTIFWL